MATAQRLSHGHRRGSLTRWAIVRVVGARVVRPRVVLAADCVVRPIESATKPTDDRDQRLHPRTPRRCHSGEAMSASPTLTPLNADSITGLARTRFADRRTRRSRQSQPTI